MGKILGTKAGGVSLQTLAAAGIAKPFMESALTPIIGDGNTISGAVKLIGGVGVNQFAGRGIVQDAVSIGLVVDGIEDLLRGVFGMGGGNVDPFGGAL